MSTHKFDPEKSHLLQDPKRLKSEPPERIWDVINKNKTRVLIDLGCGTGYFTIPFASELGPDSLVCACDISFHMLEKLKIENLNIAAVQIEEEIIPIKDNFVDLVFMGNLYHELNNRKKVLQETCRVLKSGGETAIWDWKKQQMDIGPPLSSRIPQGILENELKEQGFTDLEFYDILPYHNLVVASKK